jgi:phospholipid/cholesterol/gamma-HCH transport system ATP-binding protein
VSTAPAAVAARPDAPFAETSGLAMDHAAGLSGLDLALGPGEALHLHGPMEAGAAVLRALVGLERPRSGTVRLFGEDPAALSRSAVASLRIRVGWLPRHGALLANLTLRENLLLPLEFHDLGHPRTRCDVALARFGLEEAPELRPELVALPVRRRVALSRAVLLEPSLLLLDDPLDDLDEASAREVAAALAAWAREPGHALLVTSPDLALAAALGARRLSLPVTRT